MKTLRLRIAPRPSRLTHRLSLEALETRALLSATAPEFGPSEWKATLDRAYWAATCESCQTPAPSAAGIAGGDSSCEPPPCDDQTPVPGAASLDECETPTWEDDPCEEQPNCQPVRWGEDEWCEEEPSCEEQEDDCDSAVPVRGGSRWNDDCEDDWQDGCESDWNDNCNPNDGAGAAGNGSCNEVPQCDESPNDSNCEGERWDNCDSGRDEWNCDNNGSDVEVRSRGASCQTDDCRSERECDGPNNPPTAPTAAAASTASTPPPPTAAEQVLTRISQGNYADITLVTNLINKWYR